MNPLLPLKLVGALPGTATSQAASGKADATVDAILDLMRNDFSADRMAAASNAMDRYFAGSATPLPSIDEQRRLLMRVMFVAESEPASRPVTQAPAPTDAQSRDRVLALTLETVTEVMQTALSPDLQGLERPVAEMILRERVQAILTQRRFDLNARETEALTRSVIDEMLGFGPLEELLADPRISDIMVNGPKEVFAERGGKIDHTGIRFRDEAHVQMIARRIVSSSGRRVDDSAPMADARLPDGSRVNVILPPLALDGTKITIRKFPTDHMGLTELVSRAAMSPEMAAYLRIAAACRLNILVSGGTGSGKTTLLNALSREISARERIVTIEDAAELKLQQPHVVRLETRPASVDGTGEISMRQLLKNALRMRPDRIILGEVRGSEVIDLLQAMNTGHDGSLSTIHASGPREAIVRLANLVAMSGTSLPVENLMPQLRDALHVIVQVSRMRDGTRRVTSITEVVGCEGTILTLQDMFSWQGNQGEDDGKRGRFVGHRLPSAHLARAANYDLDDALRSLMERGVRA